MLDLSDPLTKHIFRASGLMDALKRRGQTMTVAPSSVRRHLLAECFPRFDNLRSLARAEFVGRIEFLLSAIDEYEAALCGLAALGEGKIREDRRDGDGACPVCGASILHLRTCDVVVCPSCDEPFMAAEEKLGSPDGFMTEFI